MTTVSTMPEPARTPGQLRASDADRGLVADLLSAAYAEGRLTKDELDERVAHAMAARTFDDLKPLTADLVPGSAPQGPMATASDTSMIRRSGDSGSDSVIAIFGGATRRGVWHARRRIAAGALFGGVELDFTEATFEDAVCELDCFVMFGGVEAMVPEGVNVRNEVFALFGGSDVKRLAPPDPAKPTIVLKGFCLFGGVEAKGPKPRRR